MAFEVCVNERILVHSNTNEEVHEYLMLGNPNKFIKLNQNRPNGGGNLACLRSRRGKDKEGHKNMRR